MQLILEAKLQKKQNSNSWKDKVPTEIPGYCDLDLQTLDGKIKIQKVLQQAVIDLVVGNIYTITFNVLSSTDKYGNLFFKPDSILEYKLKK